MAEATSESARDACQAWVLAGGESVRMGGQDKGLMLWEGQPMAWRIATCLAPQVQHVYLNANRNKQAYETWPWPVHADDADLPARGGPMVGALTGLRHSTASWLQLAACDTLCLPANLTARLHATALAEQAQVAVPVTRQSQSHVLWHHWTHALIHRERADSLHQALLQGERRLGKWLTQQRWVAVLFDHADDTSLFANINSPDKFPPSLP